MSGRVAAIHGYLADVSNESNRSVGRNIELFRYQFYLRLDLVFSHYTQVL